MAHEVRVYKRKCALHKVYDLIEYFKYAAYEATRQEGKYASLSIKEARDVSFKLYNCLDRAKILEKRLEKRWGISIY